MDVGKALACPDVAAPVIARSPLHSPIMATRDAGAGDPGSWPAAKKAIWCPSSVTWCWPRFCSTGARHAWHKAGRTNRVKDQRDLLLRKAVQTYHL